VSTITLRTALVVCAILGSAAPHASADPISIRTGTVQVETHLSLARIALAGDGFMFSGGTEDFFSDLRFCSPCEPVGAPISLGATWRPTGNNGGTATVNGVTFEHIVFGPGTTGTFTTPAITLSGSSPVTVSVPFTFTGLIRGFSSTLFDEELFTASVAGRGTARARLSPMVGNAGETLFSSTEIPGTDFHLEYVFGELAPTPEPATALLVGAALLALERGGRRGARSRTR
jgi:hypothetical protein